MKKNTIVALIATPFITSVYAQKPNIVVIMADDMGYSDIGCYGSEIPTPNIDRLARNGVRFTQFYNVARCCPTRATLLTGLNAHMAGIGQMSEDPYTEQNDRWNWGTDGYRGYLNRNCVTFAEVLKEAGYHTYMTGKWHVGMHGDEKRPLARGFEKYYGILSGASSYFYPSGLRHLTYMNEDVPAPDSTKYYTTDAFTDYAIQFIDEQKDNKPFLLYLAYNAPHWPLHAKKEDIQKFVGKYMQGWDEVRKKRLMRQIELGVFEDSVGLSARDNRVRPWSMVDAEQKVRSDYRMAVYAAQVYALDYNIGKLIDYLDKNGKLDNTLILFLSDNGACAEVYEEFGSKPDSYINRASFGGSVSYGIGWANASNTPFFEYKVKTFEGGISTPLIVHWPAKMEVEKGSFNRTTAHLMDIIPTLLDAAGAEYPKTFHNGNKIFPIEGFSLLNCLNGEPLPKHEYIFWEHQGYCAVRYGRWKVVKQLEDEKWKLFDIDKDRMESKDLAAENQELVKQLNEKWYEWANSHRVLPKKLKE